MPPNPAHHIAALGFATYVLLKLYGARGIALAGFLGGLVNSTVTVTELSNRVREWNGVFGDAAFRGVVLATCAMLVRNGVILAIFAPAAFRAGLLPLALMLVGTGAALIGTADGRHRPGAADRADPSRQPLPTLESPFSPMAALKFGAAFLLLQIAGTLAERSLGSAGFYAVSLAGGIVSSASAVASAAGLAVTGAVSPNVSAMGAVIASGASALVNLPIVARVGGDRRLTRKVAVVLFAAVLLGSAATAMQLLSHRA